ncbi:6-phosphogluconolactonase [bacterium]|nr:6-phosphogluconolactonase [bacterium]
MSAVLEVTAAGEWGAHVGALLALRLEQEPGRRLCLPTGSTPIPVYRSFAAMGGRLNETDVFLLDEFVLPPGHRARCDEMLKRDLLDLLDHPPRTLDRLDVDADSLDDECARYRSVVESAGLDLTLLGLGANGHLGLNEPGAAADSITRVVSLHPVTTRVAAGYGEGETPRRGATLGMSEILASHEIWLLATGEHKADILHRALTGPVEPGVPASFLQHHPRTLVLADADAARLMAD